MGQNSALSDKVNSLSQGLEKLEANLHKIEPKHVFDHPNQRSVHTKAKITKGHVAVNNKGLSGKLNPDTRNTCMQQPLAFISKHCVNMKYFGLYQQ